MALAKGSIVHAESRRYGRISGEIVAATDNWATVRVLEDTETVDAGDTIVIRTKEVLQDA